MLPNDAQPTAQFLLPIDDAESSVQRCSSHPSGSADGTSGQAGLLATPKMVACAMPDAVCTGSAAVTASVMMIFTHADVMPNTVQQKRTADAVDGQ